LLRDRGRTAVGQGAPVSGDPVVRSFVAVPLPEGVRMRLAAVADELRPRASGLAWVRPENLHLTLRFLGELDPGALARAREAVATAATAVARFTVEVGGLGGFPPGCPPRVVWAGVLAGSEELRGLYAALEAQLVARGIPAEGRAFHPHVTLARARDRRGGARLEGLLEGGPRFGAVPVAGLYLMRSELSPRGPTYSVLATTPLRDPSGVE
jgi:2'-5' RNA ligase